MDRFVPESYSKEKYEHAIFVEGMPDPFLMVAYLERYK